MIIIVRFLRVWQVYVFVNENLAKNPVPAPESTFFFDKFHCQTPQKPCSLFYITKRNINLNPKLNYNGKNRK